MMNYQNIFTAGAHKVAELNKESARRTAVVASSEDRPRRAQRASAVLWTLRLLSF